MLFSYESSPHDATVIGPCAAEHDVCATAAVYTPRRISGLGSAGIRCVDEIQCRAPGLQHNYNYISSSATATHLFDNILKLRRLEQADWCAHADLAA